MKSHIVKRAKKQKGTAAAAMLSAVLVSLSFFPCGCAYFNKFYNAKKTFQEAQDMPVPKDGSLSQNQIQKYDDVIKKCQELVATYPNSRYADDAVFLMGRCYFEQHEYDKAIQTLQALHKDLPDSKLNEDAQEYIARSYLGKDRPEQALEVLTSFPEKYPKSRHEAVILYLLGTISLRVGDEEKAMTYLESLALKYPKSTYRVQADLEMAEIFLERGEYEKSRTIYEKLAASKLKDEDDEIRCLMKLTETYVHLNMFEKALGIASKLDMFVLPLEDKASEQLLKAESYAGIDSLSQAIDLYLTVGAGYRRTKFSAESNYRLGVIYQEKLDSLETAKGYFDKVSGEYAKSPFAEEAIKRSSNISQLLKLETSLGETGDEKKAFTQLSLAEVQLLQFNDVDKALAQYKEILEKFPDSEVAPKAAFAIGYIYSTMIGDTVKAKEAYQYVLDRYPESEQADYAHRILFGTPKPPSAPKEQPVGTEQQPGKEGDKQEGAEEQQNKEEGQQNSMEEQKDKEGDEQNGGEQQRHEEGNEQDGPGDPRG